MSANTYHRRTSELLNKYGHLICPKWGLSYQNIYDNVPTGKIPGNHRYFEVRVPLIKIDGGNPIRTSRPTKLYGDWSKNVCEVMTRHGWMKLWDDAHMNPYEKIVQDYQIRTLNEMNAV